MPWRIWLESDQYGAVGEGRRDGAEKGDIPHRAELAKEVEKLLWSDVEAGLD